jgi:hypothetical protein
MLGTLSDRSPGADGGNALALVELVPPRGEPPFVLTDERELPVRLEHPEPHPLQIGDALFTRRVLHLVDRQPLDRDDVLEEATVTQDDHRSALGDPGDTPRAERQVRERHREDRERRDREHRAGDGAIVSRDALLDQIPHHDQQDQLEG